MSLGDCFPGSRFQVLFIYFYNKYVKKKALKPTKNTITVKLESHCLKRVTFAKKNCWDLDRAKS